MSKEWVYALIGLLIGIFFGAGIRGAVSSVKGKVTG